MRSIHRMIHRPRGTPVTVIVRVALIGLFVLGLGGCASTHVGNDWQCPLTQGSACTRVAGADPAAPANVAPHTRAEGEAVAEEPGARARRYRTGTGARMPGARVAAKAGASAPTCRGSCRPSERLGHGGGGEEEAPAPGHEDNENVQAVTGAGMDGRNIEGSGRDTSGGSPDNDTVNRDSARTAEVIGRIWIAPYVDAEGVYHEASWVRAVLKPAAWRQWP